MYVLDNVSGMVNWNELYTLHRLNMEQRDITVVLAANKQGHYKHPIIRAVRIQNLRNTFLTMLGTV